MSVLSNLHTDLRRARLTRRGATTPPDQAASGAHKEYPRMERILLPASPSELSQPLETLLERRHSAASIGSEALSPSAWSGLLAGLRAHSGVPRRRYPSGGGLFPIETYVVAFTPGEVRGVFHYHPKEHALERLWDIPAEIEPAELVRAEEGVATSSIILFTSVWERTSTKYGEFAYLLALMEAGHMSEDVLLATTALDLAARPFASFDDELAHHLLDIDERVEQPILAIAVGKRKVSDEINGGSQLKSDADE